jgi:hypothetical protein
VGGTQLTKINETSSVAMSALARADIESRLALAQRFPRNLDDVEVRLKRECSRRGFAEVARYRKPQGKKKNEETGRWEQNYIEGFSVRFAEAVVRSVPNLDLSTQSIYDDDEQQIMRVTLFDLETNNRTSLDVVVIKTVERRDLKPGQQPLGRRTNSYGDPVYILPATDDEIMMKRGALVAKARRNLVLQMLPGDIADSCEATVFSTLANADAKDPEGERKRLLEAFAVLGVMPSAVEEYLGHPTAVLLPGELAELRAVYSTVKTGEASWKEILEAKNPPPAAEGDSKAAKRTAEVQKKLDERKAKQDAKAKSAPVGATGAAEQPKTDAKPETAAAPAAPRERMSGED